MLTSQSVKRKVDITKLHDFVTLIGFNKHLLNLSFCLCVVEK